MRIIISGSRSLTNQSAVDKHLYESLAYIQYKYIIPKKDIIFIHGGAEGVDMMAEKFAENNGIQTKVFIPDWNNLNASSVFVKFDDKYGEYNALAGINRNYKMFDYAGRDNGMLIAFWQNKSKGTKSMIDIANRGHMPIIIYHTDRYGFEFKQERIGI